MYRIAQRSAAWMGCSVLLLGCVGPVPLPPEIHPPSSTDVTPSSTFQEPSAAVPTDDLMVLEVEPWIWTDPIKDDCRVRRNEVEV